MKKKITNLLLTGVLFATTLTTTQVFASTDDKVDLTILATSDLHGRIYPVEYATGLSQEWGIAKVATLIKQVRAQEENVLLMDNGDLIESNMINLFNDDEIHPMIKALNMLDYDTWALGNHEFNFGLDVLNNAISDFEGDVLSANVLNDDGTNFVTPYKIFEIDGVKVAVIGITPPYIPIWESSTPDHFAGLKFEDPAVATQKAVDKIKKDEDVDVIIGSFHLGLDGEGYEENTVDNVTEIIQKVDGIDVVIAGHAHSVIGTKDKQYYINDTLVVEPGSYGSYLAKVDLELEKDSDGEGYHVVSKESDLLATKGVEADKEVLDAFKYVDEKSNAAAAEEIGYATATLVADDEIRGIPRAQVEDTSVIDLINEVQMFYTGADVSGAALFDSRSNIQEGPIQFKDAALIYKYSNTLQAHKFTGAKLKAYMEWSASYYNTQQDGDATISFDENIRGYNYDMFSGVEYDIDITKPAGERIVNLTYKGEPLADDQELILAVNNYRAGTLQSLGLLPANLDETKVFDSNKTDTPEMQRLIQKYIQEEKGGVLTPEVDNNWELINLNEGLKGQDSAIKLINASLLELPKSEDGRTPNVKSINVYAAPTDEEFKALVEKAGLTGKITTKPATNGELYDQVVATLESEVNNKPQVDPVKPTVEPTKPVVDPVKPVVQPTKPVVTNNAFEVYTVRKGDTLYSIGRAYSMDWKFISHYNNLKNPNLIYVGQELRVPVNAR